MPQTNIVEILPADQARMKAQQYCSARRCKQQAEWNQSSIILVAIKRASSTTRFNPGLDEKLEAGERLIALAETGPL